MKLGKYFNLEEFTNSHFARRLSIVNRPDFESLQNLKSLVKNILDPVREHFQKPLIISSGYRSLQLNRLIGSLDKSQHVKGQAADFHISSIGHYEIIHWIQNHLEFDQVILEFHEQFKPESGWIHISYVKKKAGGKKNRQEVFMFDGQKYSDLII